MERYECVISESFGTWSYRIALNENAIIRNSKAYSTKKNAKRAALNIALKLDINLEIPEDIWAQQE